VTQRVLEVWLELFVIMVCIPCIVIPVLLWVFHKYVQPFILKFWNPWAKKSVTAGDGAGDGPGNETIDPVRIYVNCY
jgi:cell division protein FtsW (lipid II flippase)